MFYMQSELYCCIGILTAIEKMIMSERGRVVNISKDVLYLIDIQIIG